jgi:hypothetical protein
MDDLASMIVIQTARHVIAPSFPVQGSPQALSVLAWL